MSKKGEWFQKIKEYFIDLKNVERLIKFQNCSTILFSHFLSEDKKWVSKN